MVAAAKVDPAALGQPLPKMTLYGLQGALKRIGPLFAKGVKMQARNAL